MEDRYKEDYSKEEFDFEYPITWEKRNKDYLELREDRNIEAIRPEYWYSREDE